MLTGDSERMEGIVLRAVCRLGEQEQHSPVSVACILTQWADQLRVENHCEGPLTRFLRDVAGALRGGVRDE